MQKQSSKTDASLPDSSMPDMPDMPQIIRKMPLPDKPNIFTPTMKKPTDSQLVQAVVGAKVSLKRADLKSIVQPSTWKIIEACGEPDYTGDPLVESRNSIICFVAINYERKVFENADQILIKAEGAESAIFDHFAALAEVGMKK